MELIRVTLKEGGEGGSVTTPAVIYGKEPGRCGSSH
jgi:hypothetical protein